MEERERERGWCEVKRERERGRERVPHMHICIGITTLTLITRFSHVLAVGSRSPATPSVTTPPFLFFTNSYYTLLSYRVL